ncbi:MAG: hypothetical protein JNJ45_05970 [Chthonomonas sp.]|nr:hypothetical protein [Chthonomonas sp.]
MSDTTLKLALDDTGHQIRQAVAGLDLDAKPIEAMMSGRMTLAHLYECYIACRAELNGEKHKWGEYVVPQEVVDDPMAHVFALRDEVIGEIHSAGTPEATSNALSYIALHDAYHVGQLCSLRLTLDPEWNAYSIYNH